MCRNQHNHLLRAPAVSLTWGTDLLSTLPLSSVQCHLSARSSGALGSAQLPLPNSDILSCHGFQGSQQNALIATVIVGLCNHFSTYISFWLADHYGRRFLLIE